MVSIDTMSWVTLNGGLDSAIDQGCGLGSPAEHQFSGVLQLAKEVL